MQSLQVWRVPLLALCLGLNSPVFAEPPESKGRPDKAAKHAEQEKGGGGGGGGQGRKVESSESSSSVLVSAGITAALARQYAVDSRLDFSGYKPLPPGIRKNLARGKPLPPGIDKQVAPNSLRSRLPRHAGYDWQVAGTDLVLIQIGTAVVADVLKDVFR